MNMPTESKISSPESVYFLAVASSVVATAIFGLVLATLII